MTATQNSKGRSRKAPATTPAATQPPARKPRKLAAVPEPAPEPSKAPQPALRNMERRNEITHPDGAAAVATTACDACGADQGQRCTSRKGQPTNHVHAVRMGHWENEDGAQPAGELTQEMWDALKVARREARKAAPAPAPEPTPAPRKRGTRKAAAK